MILCFGVKDENGYIEVDFLLNKGPKIAALGLSDFIFTRVPDNSHCKMTIGTLR